MAMASSSPSAILSNASCSWLLSAFREALTRGPPPSSRPSPLFGGRRSRALLRLDIRRLDDRPPFLDFGLVKGEQRFGGELVAGENVLGDIGEALADDRVGERIHDGLVELGGDVFRRGPGDPECVPGRGIKSPRPRL